jgi:hypothetical protein
MKSIIIIIPYFGPFHKQFKFWLKSALNNPTIDFLLFTDNKIESKDNIKVIYTTFKDLTLMIQSKFEFPLNLYSPYKLCDCRPAYGYLFQEHIKDYDIWGWGDIDLVYGDIRHFLTEPILNRYNAFLGWGHLTLYKNNDFCNSFFKIKEKEYLYYKDVLTCNENKIFLFEEFQHGGRSDLWKNKYGDQIWLEKPFDDIIVPRLCFNFVSFQKEHIFKSLVFEYSDKNLYRIYLNSSGELVKEATLYAHFQQRKFMKVKTSNLDKYLIIPNSHINYEDITISKLTRWTKPQTLYRDFWNFKNRFMRRIKMILPK